MRKESVRAGWSGAPDRVLALIASRQHGVLTSSQLIAAGLSPRGVSHRVKAGRLHRLHRGVYAVGHAAVSREGRWLAAVLACGTGAVLSHASAATLWDLLPPQPGPVDVTLPGGGGRRQRRGIRIHRSTTLSATLTTRHRGIAVTTTPRTLADLRRVVPADRHRRAVRQAELLGLPVGAQREPEFTRSELERRFLALIRRHGLPKPMVNARVAGFEVDFLWPDRCLIVEVDGFRYHGTRSGFEADRARDAQLKVLGYDAVRFTYRQVSEEPAAVVGTLGALL